jgi:radical SAM protein with 4Fe4S-binding SPASM domain
LAAGVFERVVERADQAQVPLEVMFEVTHRCNLPCVHCYLPHHEDRGELGLDEIARLFDQLAEAGTLILMLTGGEILSRSDFKEIVELAYERGFLIRLLTNATLVTDEWAAFFAARNVVQVSVSVYGATAEVHDRVTGIVGSFERTRRGIERLVAHGLKVLIKTPVMTLNANGARDVQEMARRMSSPCSFDFTISAQNDGATGPLAYQVLRRELTEMFSQAPFSDELDDMPDRIPEPCGAGRHYCAVGPTGDVSPCIMMPSLLGNVRERSFGDIWRSHPFLARLRAIGIDDLHACGSCDVRGGCTRCPGLAMQRGQGPDGCDLTARELARAKVAAVRLRVLS